MGVICPLYQRDKERAYYPVLIKGLFSPSFVKVGYRVLKASEVVVWISDRGWAGGSRSQEQSRVTQNVSQRPH